MSTEDLCLIIPQILNATAHLHSNGLKLDCVDLDTVFIKGNLVKICSFRSASLTVNGKAHTNDIESILKFIVNLLKLSESD